MTRDEAIEAIDSVFGTVDRDRSVDAAESRRLEKEKIDALWALGATEEELARHFPGYKDRLG